LSNLVLLVGEFNFHVVNASLNDSDVFVKHFFLSTFGLGAFFKLCNLNQVLCDLLLVFVLKNLNLLFVLLKKLLLGRVGFIA
jgi:hypothetical protein